MNNIIISPPFGRYLSIAGTTPVLGTFTYQRRYGLIQQTIKTFRPYQGGYINQIGLRNPGLEYFVPKAKHQQAILSITALSYDEWQPLAMRLATLKTKYGYQPLALEINLGCPNIAQKPVIDVAALSLFNDYSVIVKLPPTDHCLSLIDIGLKASIRWFHLCNTLPSKHGGISGPLLKPVSLHYIEQAKQYYGHHLNLIGGGGIYTVEDAKLYLTAGCKKISLATAALNLIQFSKIVRYMRTQSN